MEAKCVKQFNTTGPCVPGPHYMLPVLARWPDVQEVLDNENNFILYAPHQSGKTTFIQHLTAKINEDGQRYAINPSIGTVRGQSEVSRVLETIVNQINMALKRSELEILRQKAFTYDSCLSIFPLERQVRTILNLLSRDLDKPLVVFFDGANSLYGPGRWAFIEQIRAGYNERDEKRNRFPSSLALIGTRYLRDYFTVDQPESRAAKGQACPESQTGLFQEKSLSVALADFSPEDIAKLYGQHTEATGQVFEAGAIERAWYWSAGQPWIVNALAYVLLGQVLKKDYSVAITASHIDQATKALILRNDTHFDYLKVRLEDHSVRIFTETFVNRAPEYRKFLTDDDINYTLALGLFKIVDNGRDYLPANPIYAKLIKESLAQGRCF
jgi:hypothetical protein